MPETSDGRRTSGSATDAGTRPEAERTASDEAGGDRPAADQTAGERAAVGICPVAFCPICATISVVNRASPEVVDHLLSAAREFLLAARAVLDARAADYDDDPDRDRTLQRIDIR